MARRLAPLPPPSSRRTKLVKLVVALAVVGAFALLILRSARDSGAMPYSVSRDDLRNWSLVMQPGSGPSEPMLWLRPPPALASGLFDQVFRRVMESMSKQSEAAVPLVLQGEFDHALAGRLTPETLLAAARAAGLESVPFTPLCLGHRRVTEPGAVKQVYFVLFEAPAFGRFRERIAASAAGPFDASALSPVLLIGVAQSTFNAWLPLRGDPPRDCVAPIAAS